MTLRGVVSVDEHGQVGYLSRLYPQEGVNQFVVAGQYYPHSSCQRERINAIERRVAAGTFKCEHCSEPLTGDHKADARFCDTRCRVAAHYARWNKWNETVIKTAEDNLANTTRQYGPDHHRTHEAQKHLEWALSNRGRRKNRKPGRSAHF